MMLKTVSIIGALALGILLAPLSALAQQPAKVSRIGFLSTGVVGPNVEAFRQGLQELNDIVGQNIAIEYRWAAGGTIGSRISQLSWFDSKLTSSSPRVRQQLALLSRSPKLSLLSWRSAAIRLGPG